MFWKIFYLIFIVLFVGETKCKELERSYSVYKNCITTCSISSCSIAIEYCMTQCYSVNDCKSCLINRDPLCSICANDIFNSNNMFQVYGQSYLLCDQYGYFQASVCQFYCKAYSKTIGKCNDVQGLSACLCYNSFNGNSYNTITGSSQIRAVASSPNYHEFAIGFSNGSISVLDNYGRFRRSFIVNSGSTIENIVYLSNGDIATTGSFGTRLYSNSGVNKATFSSNPGYAVAILKSGEIAFSYSNWIYVSNISSYSYKLLIKGHQSTVYSLLGLPNGDLVSGSNDKTIKIWNTADGSLKKTLIGHTGSVRSLILLENGNIASGSDDRTIRIWNIDIATPIKIISSDHTDWIRSIALLPNGQIASASDDKTVKIWDKDTGILDKTLTGFSNYVMNLAVTSNNYLVAVSLDNNIRIWH